jgi:ribosomal-protein-alanine N-acetyltransferase
VTNPVPEIRSQRLRLVSLSPTAIRALLEGRHHDAERETGVRFPPEWPGEDRRVLEIRLEQMTKDQALQEWLLRIAALPDGTMVGHAGFHGPPRERGEVEMGYTVLPAFRSQGYATEAARALMAWAQAALGVTAFVASVSPGNAASLRLVQRLGFRQAGVQVDEEDGEELVFELDLTAAG